MAGRLRGRSALNTATGAILAAWMALAAASTLGCALYLRLLRRPQPRSAAAPPVLVAVPVRGDAGLEGFLSALSAQDYAAWRVVFTVEDRADPAFPALARFAAAHPSRAEVVVAGATERRAQKVRPPSPASAGIDDALRFGLRQHRLMRLHSPGRWALAGLLLALPAAGGAAALGMAAAGSRAALACLV